MGLFGMLLIFLGFLAIGTPFVAGLSLTMALGLILVAAGIIQLVWTFKSPTFQTGVLPFLWGVITLVAGIYTISQPATALAVITLALTTYFFVSGVYEVWLALHIRPRPGWGWTMFGGVVTLILALMIWNRFPTSAAWLVGTLVGIKLIFAGWAILRIRAVAGAVSDAIEAS